MGVRGLTSYIAKNADRYLKPYELHDCNLVIDGDSLSSNLYRWNSECNSAFGGDYDQYYRTVVQFFNALHQCNVTPYVLLDGGYPRKKLATVRSRLRAKIGAVKHINPFSCLALFPLLMRDVFVDALKACAVPFMRCVFEADDEVAILARRLNCPVLSYDSDFYIHNVQYIPSVTLTAKVRRKKVPRKELKKQNPAPIDSAGSLKYNYLDCCLYKIENLVGGQLKDDMLPLFAALLGNDYVNRKLFKKFYDKISLKKCGGKRDTKQQRRIIALLKWLQHETLESAITKVLARLPREDRVNVLRQINNAMSGYNLDECRAFMFFNLEVNDANHRPLIDVDILLKCNDNVVSDDEDHSDNGDGTDESDSESNNDDGGVKEKPATADIEADEVETDTHMSFRNYEPPEWLLNKILKAEVPRFIVDLLYLKLYVNAPQIENFMLPDCNEIAIPILQFVFALLHLPDRPTFQYLTRVLRISNVHYKKLSCIVMNNLEFDPTTEMNQSQLFSRIFEIFPDHTEIFAQIKLLPSKWQLFFLAIVYWTKRSNVIDGAAYVHAVIISCCVLSEADHRCQPISRDYRVFQKRYGTIIKAYESKDTEIDQTTPKSISGLCESLAADESVMLLNQLLTYFYISDNIRERHTNYSSTIIHSFAELQSIVFNLNALNGLLNYPFESIAVAQFMNGTFLYNMYVGLKDRPNIEHYVKHHTFRGCSNYYGLYEQLIKVCEPIVECLRNKIKTKKSQLRNRRRNKRKRMNATQGKGICETVLESPMDVDGSGSEYDDQNNIYSKLLMEH